MSWPSISRLRFVPSLPRPVKLPPGHLPPSRALRIAPSITSHSHSIPWSYQTPPGPSPKSGETRQPVATHEINLYTTACPDAMRPGLPVNTRTQCTENRVHHLPATVARTPTFRLRRLDRHKPVGSAPTFHLARRKITLLHQFAFQSRPSKNPEQPKFGFSDGLLLPRSLVKCRSARSGE